MSYSMSYGTGRTGCVRVCGVGGCILLNLVHSAHFRYSQTGSVSDILEFCYKMMNSSTRTLKVTDVLSLKYCFGKIKIDPLHLK